MSLNAIFDVIPIDEDLSGNFSEVLKRLESVLLMQLNTQQHTVTTLTDGVYFFCKFQAGSPDLWNAMENQIERTIKILSIEHLSKVALALSMNNRPIKPELASALYNAVLERIEKAKATDAFYLSMAIGKGLRQKFSPDDIKNFSDICYNLYLVTAREINSFDLFQLAQVSNFLCSPEVTGSIPDEFWTETLGLVLDDYLAKFLKYSSSD